MPQNHSDPVPSPSTPFRCGYVAIVGRPNVGKSTLLNRLIGQKLAITSDRPQTTRHRITGVVHLSGAQLLVLDSPGIQHDKVNAMNRVLNRTADHVARDADVVVMVCEASRWRDADERIARSLPRGVPRILAINKIDQLKGKDKASLYEWAPAVQQQFGFDELVPVSAKSGFQVALLAELCAQRLPVGEPVFEADALTDRSERFLAAETVREKLFRQLGDELPYASTVVIDRFEQTPRLRRIFATILVERDSQKAIVLGQHGTRIKRLSTDARQDLEQLLGGPVYLEVFVKVRSGWADNEQSLRAYGYE